MHENHFFNSKFIRNNFDIYCLKQSHICHRPYLQFKFCVCERVFFLPMLLGHFLTDCNLAKPLYGHSFNLWLFRSLFIVLFRVFFSLFKVVILKKKENYFRFVWLRQLYSLHPFVFLTIFFCSLFIAYELSQVHAAFYYNFETFALARKTLEPRQPNQKVQPKLKTEQSWRERCWFSSGYLLSAAPP